MNSLISESYRKEQEALRAAGFIEDRYVGSLPKEWNWLCDEYGTNHQAKILHWTCGIPGFEHYKNAPHAGKWFRANARANHAAH